MSTDASKIFRKRKEHFIKLAIPSKYKDAFPEQDFDTIVSAGDATMQNSKLFEMLDKLIADDGDSKDEVFRKFLRVTKQSIPKLYSEYCEPSSESVWFEAVKNGDVVALHSLIISNDIYPDIEDEKGSTALGIASKVGNPATVQFLLTLGARTEARVGDSEGYTPLCIAVRWDSEECLRLLCRVGADANVRTKNGWVPVHIAARWNRHLCLSILLEHGASVDSRNQKGSTPLHIAAGYGSLECVKLLLKRGADANARDDSGETPLDWAIANSHKESVDVFSITQKKEMYLADNNESTEDRVEAASPAFVKYYEKTFVHIDVAICEFLATKDWNRLSKAQQESWEENATIPNFIISIAKAENFQSRIVELLSDVISKLYPQYAQIKAAKRALARGWLPFFVREGGNTYLDAIFNDSSVAKPDLDQQCRPPEVLILVGSEEEKVELQKALIWWRDINIGDMKVVGGILGNYFTVVGCVKGISNDTDNFLYGNILSMRTGIRWIFWAGISTPTVPSQSQENEIVFARRIVGHDSYIAERRSNFLKKLFQVRRSIHSVEATIALQKPSEREADFCYGYDVDSDSKEQKIVLEAYKGCNLMLVRGTAAFETVVKAMKIVLSSPFLEYDSEFQRDTSSSAAQNGISEKYVRLARNDYAYVSKARFCLVGDTGAGKTAFVNALLLPNMKGERRTCLGKVYHFKMNEGGGIKQDDSPDVYVHETNSNNDLSVPAPQGLVADEAEESATVQSPPPSHQRSSSGSSSDSVDHHDRSRELSSKPVVPNRESKSKQQASRSWYKVGDSLEVWDCGGEEIYTQACHLLSMARFIIILVSLRGYDSAKEPAESKNEVVRRRALASVKYWKRLSKETKREDSIIVVVGTHTSADSTLFDSVDYTIDSKGENAADTARRIFFDLYNEHRRSLLFGISYAALNTLEIVIRNTPVGWFPKFVSREKWCKILAKPEFDILKSLSYDQWKHLERAAQKLFLIECGDFYFHSPEHLVSLISLTLSVGLSPFHSDISDYPFNRNSGWVPNVKNDPMGALRGTGYVSFEMLKSFHADELFFNDGDLWESILQYKEWPIAVARRRELSGELIGFRVPLLMSDIPVYTLDWEVAYYRWKTSPFFFSWSKISRIFCCQDMKKAIDSKYSVSCGWLLGRIYENKENRINMKQSKIQFDVKVIQMKSGHPSRCIVRCFSNSAIPTEFTEQSESYPKLRIVEAPIEVPTGEEEDQANRENVLTRQEMSLVALDKGVIHGRLCELHTHLLGMGSHEFWVDWVIGSFIPSLRLRYHHDIAKQFLEENAKGETAFKALKEHVIEYSSGGNLVGDKEVMDLISDVIFIRNKNDIEVRNKFALHYTTDVVYSKEQLLKALFGYERGVPDLGGGITSQDELSMLENVLANIECGIVFQHEFRTYIVYNVRAGKLEWKEGIRNSYLRKTMELDKAEGERTARSRAVCSAIRNCFSMLNPDGTEPSQADLTRFRGSFSPQFDPMRFALKDCLYEQYPEVLSFLLNCVCKRYAQAGVSYVEFSIGAGDLINERVSKFLLPESVFGNISYNAPHDLPTWAGYAPMFFPKFPNFCYKFLAAFARSKARYEMHKSLAKFDHLRSDERRRFVAATWQEYVEMSDADRSDFLEVIFDSGQHPDKKLFWHLVDDIRSPGMIGKLEQKMGSADLWKIVVGVDILGNEESYPYSPVTHRQFLSFVCNRNKFWNQKKMWPQTRFGIRLHAGETVKRGSLCRNEHLLMMRNFAAHMRIVFHDIQVIEERCSRYWNKIYPILRIGHGVAFMGEPIATLSGIYGAVGNQIRDAIGNVADRDDDIMGDINWRRGEFERTRELEIARAMPVGPVSCNFLKMRMFFKKHGIPLEMNMTSNDTLLTQVSCSNGTNKVGETLRYMLKEKLKVVIGTDDDGVWPIHKCRHHYQHISVANEFCTAICGLCELTKDETQEMIQQSRLARFSDSDTKSVSGETVAEPDEENLRSSDDSSDGIASNDSNSSNESDDKEDSRTATRSDTEEVPFPKRRKEHHESVPRTTDERHPTDDEEN